MSVNHNAILLLIVLALALFQLWCASLSPVYGASCLLLVLIVFTVTQHATVILCILIAIICSGSLYRETIPETRAIISTRVTLWGIAQMSPSRSRRYLKGRIEGRVVSFEARRRPSERIVLVKGYFSPGFYQRRRVPGLYQVVVPELPWNGVSEMAIGQGVSVRGSLVVPVFDSTTRYYYSHSVVTRFYGRSFKFVGPRVMRAWWEQFRDRFLREKVFRFARFESISLLFALTLGATSLLSESQKALFRATGTSHMLSISGLHVGVVYLLATVFSRWALTRSLWLVTRFHIDRFVPLVGLIASFLYVAVSGAKLPAVRASLVIMLLAGASMTGRRRDPVRNLLLSALLLMISWPRCFLELGFQLSFAALSGLLCCAEVIARRDRLRRRRAQLLGREEGEESSIRVQLTNGLFFSFAAYLSTLPLVVTYFGYSTPLAIVYNATMIPLLSWWFISLGIPLVLLSMCNFWGIEIVFCFFLWIGDALLSVFRALAQ